MLKEKIQQGIYKIGDYLPSENELCAAFKITRTTVRKALDELLKDGFIEKHHGKGSIVKDRRNSLGLLTVKGFSEAAGYNVKTIFLQIPEINKWNPEKAFKIEKGELEQKCVYFERLRCVEGEPVMLEKNWFSLKPLKGFIKQKFVNDSFFKTLSQKYLIEITGSEQELRASSADDKTAYLLKIKPKSPILHILIRFSTTHSDLHIYSELFCNTKNFPISNSYYL
jgi:GntR family transcriptional regulator/GntR family frlABCD operon transcriptional regulator